MYHLPSVCVTSGRCAHIIYYAERCRLAPGIDGVTTHTHMVHILAACKTHGDAMYKVNTVIVCPRAEETNTTLRNHMLRTTRIVSATAVVIHVFVPTNVTLLHH